MDAESGMEQKGDQSFDQTGKGTVPLYPGDHYDRLLFLGIEAGRRKIHLAQEGWAFSTEQVDHEMGV